MSLFKHFQQTVKETRASKLCDFMKEKLPESIYFYICIFFCSQVYHNIYMYAW